MPAATSLLGSLSNPLNLQLLSSQILSSEALWEFPHDLTFSRQVFGAFYTAASNVSQHAKQNAPSFSYIPVGRLAPEDWIKAIVKGADEKSPRWRHVLLLGGVLLGFGHGNDISQYLRQKLETGLIRATNLAVDSTAPVNDLAYQSIILVLNHTFDLLSDTHRAQLRYDALLPPMVETIFMSKEGLEQGTFLSRIDIDVQETSGKRFRWSSQSPSCNRTRALLSKPLTSALGPLSRLTAHTLENVSNPTLVLDTLARIADFARVLAVQWRQNKLSEIDASEETVYLDDETTHTSLPLLWQTLRSILFTAVIIQRSALGRVLNDPRLATGHKAVEVAVQTLHTLRNLYFISSRLGQTSMAQYQFVTYTAIDILNVHPEHVKGFLQAIRPHTLGRIPDHPVDRCLDLFFLNTAEHFTLTLSPQKCEELLLAAPIPYLVVGGNNSLLEIFEAAHSLILAVFAAPQNAALTVRHLPFYIDTLFKVFPTNLSERQFRFAFKTLITVISPPASIATDEPLLAPTLLQLVFDRAWDAPNTPLPPMSTNTNPTSTSLLSEQAALVMALLDSLPHVSPQVLEEWLPLAASLLTRIKDANMLQVCKQRFWDIMSNGEMDVQRATVAVTWWTTRGGREWVLFGDEQVDNDPYMMSGGLQQDSKL